jgi:kumamolisin
MGTQTRRVPLPHSERGPVFGAKSVGTPDPQERIEVTVYLRRKVALPPPGAKSVSREQFAGMYGADPDDVSLIQGFAHEYGLDVVDINVARRSVVLSGTVEALTSAFGATLQLQQIQGQVFRARTGTLTVPAELQSVVEAVFGLDNRPQAKPHLRVLKPASTFKPLKGSPLKSFTGSQVASLYKFPPGTDGTGECIALIELGGGYKAKNLQSYFQSIGLKPPQVTAVSVDKAHNHPTGDPSGPDGEVVLDIEVAGAAAPGAKIAVYFAPNTDRGFVDAITTAIHDNVNKPSVISISWGSAEDAWTAQARTQMDNAFQAAGTLNVSVFVAAGDDGSSDGESDSAAHVDFPASSPHVTACGGTRLTETNANAIADEVVWNDGPSQGATGGGVSQYFGLPTYQQQAKVPKSVNDGFVGRGVPDIAGNADPQTGYILDVDGQSITVGGTSAVAPLYAALVARVNQAKGSPAGFLNPILYASSMAPAGYRDIAKGNNGAYSAGPQWDACTGWGSVIGTALLAAVQGHKSPSVAPAVPTPIAVRPGSDRVPQHHTAPPASAPKAAARPTPPVPVTPRPVSQGRPAPVAAKSAHPSPPAPAASGRPMPHRGPQVAPGPSPLTAPTGGRPRPPVSPPPPRRAGIAPPSPRIPTSQPSRPQSGRPSPVNPMTPRRPVHGIPGKTPTPPSQTPRPGPAPVAPSVARPSRPAGGAPRPPAPRAAIQAKGRPAPPTHIPRKAPARSGIGTMQHQGPHAHAGSPPQRGK